MYLSVLIAYGRVYDDCIKTLAMVVVTHITSESVPGFLIPHKCPGVRPINSYIVYAGAYEWRNRGLATQKLLVYVCEIILLQIVLHVGVAYAKLSPTLLLS